MTRTPFRIDPNKDSTTRTRPILFFREGYFYPTEYPADYSNWQAEADRNPGTIRIVDALTDRVLWPLRTEVAQ